MPSLFFIHPVEGDVVPPDFLVIVISTFVPLTSTFALLPSEEIVIFSSLIFFITSFIPSSVVANACIVSKIFFLFAASALRSFTSIDFRLS